MPYNPGVTNHGGEYIMRGAEIAGQAMGSAIGERLQQAEQNRQQNEYFTARGEDLARMQGADGQPLMDADTLAKFHGAGVNAKKGMLADALFRYEQTMQQQQRGDQLGARAEQKTYQYSALAQGEQHHQDEMSLRRDELARRQENDAPFTPTPEMLQSYEKAGYVYLPQSRHGGTAAPIKNTAANAGDPLAMPVDGGRVIDLGNGRRVFSKDANRPLPESAISQIKLEQMGLDQAVGLRDEALKQLAAGNKKHGPDWAMGGSYQKQLEEANATIAKHQEKIDQVKQLYTAPASSAAPAAAKAPDAAPPKFADAAAVRAAFKAGQIDQATAAQILRTQFGMQ